MLETSSFFQDSLIRNQQGQPQGRVVLVDSHSYVKGATSFEVAVLKVLRSHCSAVLGFEFYIDGVKYKVPEKLNNVKVRKLDKEWVVTNFVLKRV